MVEGAPAFRKLTREYAESHQLQQALSEAVQQALRERAPNCLHRVAHLLLHVSYVPSAASSKGAPALGSEQVQWRAKMVRDMATGMELEIRHELEGSTLEAERCETFRALMAANALSRGAGWLSSDEHFSAALKAALTLKQEIVRPEAVLEMLGSLPPRSREQAVPFVARFLDSPTAALRRAATELLGGNTHHGVTVSRPRRVQGAVLAVNARSARPGLLGLTRLARGTAGCLPPLTGLATRSYSPLHSVRSTIPRCGRHAMPPSVLAPHTDAIVRRLGDADPHVRHAAGEMLGKPPPAIGLQPPSHMGG